MSSTAEKVRSLALSFARNVVFTTGQLLTCGSRNAVDIELCRLVKAGTIKRLASGVFANVSSNSEGPGVLEIARAKAQRFGKRLIEDAQASTMQFCSDGCKTAFASVYGRIYFKAVSPGFFLKASQKAAVNTENADARCLEDRSFYSSQEIFVRQAVLQIKLLIETLSRHLSKLQAYP